MASVFLSYARDDAAKAQAIAEGLEAAGHDVWWDRYLRGGSEYSEEIEEALNDSDWVVVLWSKHSVKSAWVRDEASAGRERGRLVPVLIDAVRQPMGFRQIQSVDLANWSPRRRSSRFAELLNALDLPREPKNQSDKGDDGSSARRSSQRGAAHETDIRVSRRYARLGPATIVLVLVAIALWFWLQSDRATSPPVVKVAAADDSPGSQAAASNLFVKLGSLAQLGQGNWQLVDASDSRHKPDLIFRTAETGSEAQPSSSLVLIDGKSSALLWSREFKFPSGKRADLRQQLALTTGRVLDCALASRRQGGLSPDLLKLFLNSCSALADLSGDDYAPVIAQLRQVVDRVPQFEPAWRRLISAESTALNYARYSPAAAPLRDQLKSDMARARGEFPKLPELAIAELAVEQRKDYGRDIALLDDALAREPDNPKLLAQLSAELMGVGRMEDAVSKARRAAELDPLAPGGMSTYIMTLAHAGEIDAARRELAQAEQLWAGTGSLADVQIAFSMRYGDPQVVMKLDPTGYASAAYFEARTNPTPSNIARFKALVDEFRPKSVTPDQIGWAIQGLGEFGLVDDAYYWLDRASPDQIAELSYLLFRPSMGSVRRDPRFMLLAARIGLVQYWRASGAWADFCQRPGIPYDCKTEAAKHSTRKGGD